MILIADSGSTKTDWRLIGEDKLIQQFSTEGLNPYFQSEEKIISVVKDSVLSQAKGQLEHFEIYFYGAGCAAQAKKQIVSDSLSSCFPTSQIYVETDMLGAARSLCGSNPGLAGILGTGANTCFYDGYRIIENGPSLGFILGDEGSGAHIGKSVVQAILNEELSKEICSRFYKRYETTKEEILDSVYRHSNPNRYLAAFSKFAYQNQKDQEILTILINCFNSFFDKQILKYQNINSHKLHLTGSVAFYYSNLIRAIADSKGIQMGTITESPIAGLTLFHLGEVD